MTFISLSKNNFVQNKINNIVKVEYDKNNSETFLYDQNVDSKSIINIQPYEEITVNESGLRIDDSNLNDKLSAIQTFYQSVSENSLKSVEYDDANSVIGGYFFEKSLLEENQLNNENIKKFNFKNSFNIKKINQKFLPDSFQLRQKI